MLWFRRVLVLLLLVGLCVAAAGMPAFGQQPLPSQSVGGVPTEGLSSEVKTAAVQAVRGEGNRKSGGSLSKIGMELALLYFQYREQGPSGVQATRTEAVGGRERVRAKADVHRRTNSKMVYPVSPDGRFVSVDAVPTGQTSELLRDLRRLGLSGGARAGNVVSGRFPVAELEEAAQLTSLRAMIPSYARTHVGSVESEADTSHAVYKVRQQKDLDGSRQKICALSDSYNNFSESSPPQTTASDDVQSGDLPGPNNPLGNTTPVDVLSDSIAGGDEGRAMLQLIHDLAPGAELGFHTAAGGLGVFVHGIRALADPNRGDCTVIVDDIGYNIEPFYQDGPISNTVDEVVNNREVPYFSSAGNDGQNSYQAQFRNSGQTGVINSTSELHDFDPSESSTDTRQEITLPAGETFRIFTFQWTDPSSIVQGSVGADTDIDVAVVDGDDNILAESSQDNLSSGVPVEGVLEYTNQSGAEQTVYLIIEKAAGPDPDEVKYIYSGGGTIVDDYGDTLNPTIYGHPMAEGALAVAAAPFFNTEAYNSNVNTATLDFFSAKGGIPILFDQSGAPLASPEQRPKPDVTGTDFIDNTFFGTDLPTSFGNGIDSDPHPNFPGTSAAAPNIAAIGALIRQARPGFTPQEVYNRLESTALDVTERQNRNGNFVAISAGFDPWSGHGFVPAQDAVPDRDIFDLQLAEEPVGSGSYQLSWTERSDASVQSYTVKKKYFDGPFETVLEDVNSDGDLRTLNLGELGLGVFQFRVEWTRSDGTDLEWTTRPDTLDFVGFETTAQVPEGVPNLQGRRDVALSWTVPAGTDGFTYHVQRKRGEDGDFEDIASTQNRLYDARLQVPGEYSYRITARDGQGNSLTSPTRDLEISLDGSAVVVGPYPNPVQEETAVDFSVQKRQRVTIEVFNVIGERLYREQRLVPARTATPLTFDATRWSSGLYFIRLRGDDFSRTRKFTVVK